MKGVGWFSSCPPRSRREGLVWNLLSTLSKPMYFVDRASSFLGYNSNVEPPYLNLFMR